MTDSSDFADLSEPARGHLSTAARELDKLAGIVGQIPDLKAQAREALPGTIADSLCDLLDHSGAVLQDNVHTGRAGLATVANMARAEQQAPHGEMK